MIVRQAFILFWKFILLAFFSIVSTHSRSQIPDTIKEASLPDVLVKSYERNTLLKDLPAPINYVARSTFEHFTGTSIVSAVNTTPGVRMEERSPGSYRFNIRGSALRSPFGVRNVKVYFNDIPITDPGGHTYLNQLGYHNFNSIEVIKGPGSSIYGAGTGGVILIESLNNTQRAGVFAEYATGSYGLKNIYAAATTSSDKLISSIGFQHQQSDGFRNHSELRRGVFTWNGLFNFDNNRLLRTTFLYGDLFYQTPGALTKIEREANPRSARPSTQFIPGSEAARAAIFQKTFYAGASYSQPISSKIHNKTILYGAFTELRNPTIRNYGRSSEPHLGGRTVFKYQQPLGEAKLQVDLGAEIQQGFTTFSLHKNLNGNADSLQSNDETVNRQYFIFTQASLDISTWTFTAGVSSNSLKINFQRFGPNSLGKQVRKFDNELAPRISVMKKWKNINIYSSLSKGFSPPTTAELLPTGGAINLSLNAEEGVNYDVGVRGSFGKGLFIDINAFTFSLNNTIVQRFDAGSGDFFVNAGKTKQKGVETSITYPLFHSLQVMERSMFWLSHTYHHFRYKEFKQLTADFSGNRLPGISPRTISTGIDFLTKTGWLGNVNYYLAGKIPLNDANDEYANAYHLAGARIGFQQVLRNNIRMKLFVGVDNLLNEKYSLGNDINGFGRRYYNAAPGRNYYGGLALQLYTNKLKADIP